MANQDEFANQDELNHETDLGRSFQKPKRPSMNLYRGRSSLEEPRSVPADEHDGYSAVKYYSTFQEPGKMQHAAHGSAGDLAALDQIEDPKRTSMASKRPQSASAKPGRSDIEERLAADGNVTTASTTTSSYSAKSGKENA
ncbi:hypothetical protein ABBQ32_008955 [Trebouxia sp. C0010 RCD-2024]